MSRCSRVRPIRLGWAATAGGATATRAVGVGCGVAVGGGVGTGVAVLVGRGVGVRVGLGVSFAGAGVAVRVGVGVGAASRSPIRQHAASAGPTAPVCRLHFLSVSVLDVYLRDGKLVDVQLDGESV